MTTDAELRELNERVSAVMEPRPAVVPVGMLRETAEARREEWRYSWHTFDSPGGWWLAQIGNDGGVYDDPCEWVPAREPAVEIGDAWDVLGAVRQWDGVRQAVFLEELSEVILTRLGSNNPMGRLSLCGVMMNLQPSDICRAAVNAATLSGTRSRNRRRTDVS